ncbi:hypothetical protein A2715_02490 [Candidatus Woesebacteria bacterium RIFCSPHIGHO2_01_FULL_39_32]|uniref:Uncharacterized protein n=1 Tax=Candidatus Woesebacteria bacterium RIFCSPLOWO2_01_FULL_39_25 TaxID=1802521 RepID=A0A1F8BLZ8_9BACT|nr:MAG: hypothetical protein A2124_02155 [Candidatus Woesebacteria bacterium GWB1_37_5]OGM24022.1 MAG: hypothetical protein A2715_02490 [Candidatus Woesebacteria bacterium RIFCSPHIGHO2_01_FULL_39_32]OGM38021.1 MAG: hypothetical protein A3F01_05800 [Candidatus Woesebacteria bacterium RIFCSPHIGHO2_12_FULL_38_11]OGM64365.1 MAG: hypothetical protein A2893_00665 [Candidatus Woesebacteria bacterium RIFCSPLOWO2_01_FULL_39_25]
MLLWAIFTLGFLFGVFLALSVFLKKDIVEGSYNEKFVSLKSESTDPWFIHKNLIRVNTIARKVSRTDRPGTLIAETPDIKPALGVST